MQNYITYGRLQVAEQLDAFINIAEIDVANNI